MKMKMDTPEGYAERLASLLRYETVSHDELREPEKFAGFHALLRETFPSLFAASDYENIDGSMLLRWRGRDDTVKPMLFMNHSDVVAPGTGWRYPPFSGTVAEGKVWGRGALDTKGGLWAMLEAADTLAGEGFVPEGDIYFESSCCEEVTCTDCGAKPVAKLLAERGIRFSFILDEGGAITYEPIGGIKGTFAMVGMGERGIATLRFTAKGHGGHASAPEKDSPLVRLGRFMAEADSNKQFTVEIAPVLEEMFRRFSPYAAGIKGKIYAHPRFFRPLLERIMPSLGGTSRALCQTTIAFTMAKGSDGFNVIPSEASVIGNMRISHHEGFTKSLAAMQAMADRYGLSVEILEWPEETHLCSYDTPAFRLVEEAVSAFFPGVVTAPYIMTGGSDARYMESLGDSCFRFTPFLISREQMEGIHGLNESVDVSTLTPAVGFYRYLMEGGAKIRG